MAAVGRWLDEQSEVVGLAIVREMAADLHGREQAHAEFEATRDVAHTPAGSRAAWLLCGRPALSRSPWPRFRSGHTAKEKRSPGKDRGPLPI